MRLMFAVLALTFSALLAGGLTAGGVKEVKGKEVKLTGKICCAKCELSMADDCATVIVVGKGKDAKIYYFDADGHKKHHEAICTTPMEGSVTGIVGTEGKKHTVKVKSLEFKK